MAIPERMIPVKVSSKKIRELAQKAKEILAAIDSGASEEDAFLKDMIDDWNSQVVCPCEFSDFRDYSSWTNANEFTRIAFNLEKFYEDFTWEELVQTISCVCDQKSNESEKIFALLIFWPDEWFQDPDMLDVELSVEEIACYLMVRSGRQLVDAPEIDLKYQIPQSDE
ncbi:TPA: hypothetical protein O7P46_004462 [Escherichia coli]|nr:hypothetical protein [Escherichia coli]